MKIHLKNNKVFFENQGLKKEIHPFWLRERVDGDSFVDKATQQRLFDPTELKANIQINSLTESFDLGINNYLSPDLVHVTKGVKVKTWDLENINGD